MASVRPAYKADEVRELVAHNVNLHQATMPHRSRMRGIMNGGEEGLKRLLGAELVKVSAELPVANFPDINLEKLARRVAKYPQVSVPWPLDASTDTQSESEKIERVVAGYDGVNSDAVIRSRLRSDLRQAARWLPAYGFAVWVIRRWVSPQDYLYPMAELRGSYDAFPSQWGPQRQPRSLAILRGISARNLAALLDRIGTESASNHAERVRQRALPKAGGVVDLGAMAAKSNIGAWEGPGAEYLVGEYYDQTGSYLVALNSDVDDLLAFAPNPSRSHPPFVVVTKYSFDEVVGKYHHVWGLMATMSKISMAAAQALYDSVFAETNIAGRMISRSYEYGRNARNFFEAGTQISKPNSNVPYQVFDRLGPQLEAHTRMQISHPVQDDQRSPSGFNTGKALEELGISGDEEEEEYTELLVEGVQVLDALRLETDESEWPGRKPIMGQRAGAPGAELYDPAVDINGRYITERRLGPFGTMGTRDALIAGLQAFRGELIDKRTAQRLIPGIADDIAAMDERQIADAMQEVIIQTVQALAAGASPEAQQDPTRAREARVIAVESWLDPSRFKDLIQELWSGEGDQPPPAQQDFLGGGGGALPRPDSVQTLLSRLPSQGRPQAGVQTVTTRRS